MDEYSTTNLSHLLPAAQNLARLPADERIRANRWIGYPRAVDALNRLETLYAWPGKQRMPNLLLVEPTNNGKSMIIEKFRRTHPARSDAYQEYIPVLVVAVGACTAYCNGSTFTSPPTTARNRVTGAGIAA